MYWELWDVESKNLVETFETEDEGLQGVRELLAVNRPELVDDLVLGAAYDEDEPREIPLPPVLTSVELRARLAETAPEPAAENATRAVHDQIRRWLAEEGWQVRDVDDPQAIFNVTATLPHGTSVNIFQYRAHVDHITLSQHWKYDAEFQAALRQLDDNDLSDVVWNLYRDVSMMGIFFSGLDTPSTEMTLRTVVYFDGLTKDTLFREILLTLRALALAIQTLIRALEVQGRADKQAQSPTRVPLTREDLKKVMRSVPQTDVPLIVAS